MRRFSYDSLSRLLTASNPESNAAKDAIGNFVRVPTVYAYDSDANLLMKTSAAPNQQSPAVTQTISYCYDELHRVTVKDYLPHTYTPPNCPITSPIVTYSYDSGANAIGHLTHLSDRAGTADYTYDPLGRVATRHA